MSNTNTDTYTVEPTGSFIKTRHGDKPEYILRRNGVAIRRSTQADCERERDLRIKTGRNPLAGIGGQFA